MSGFFRAQVSIPSDTGLPKDAIVNTWHFESDQSFADDADDVAGRLIAFYQAIDGVVLAAIADTPVTIKMYDMADAEPRVPGYITTFTLAPASGTVTPPEIAMCLSFRGALASGVNMARRRGRVFLGPIHQGVLTLASGYFEFTSSAREAVRDAAVTLASGPDPGDGRLAVFSPTTALAGRDPEDVDQFTELELAAAYEDVVEVWVDSAPDIQRRRGQTARSRTTGTV